MIHQTDKSTSAPSRRAALGAIGAGVVGVIAGMTCGGAATAQSAGTVTITIDENLGSVFGLAEILIDQEPQGVLSAGCCMYLQVGPGTHDLTLRWPDHKVSATFETDGDETIAFHLTAERTLILLEE